MREGRDLPQRMQNAPELMLGLQFYMNAFFELHTCRPAGMDVGPIPWSVIQQYGSVYGLSDEEQEDLHYLVREMDEEYLKFNRRRG